MVKNQLLSPSEFSALDSKGEFRRFEICSVSATIDTDRSISNPKNENAPRRPSKKTVKPFRCCAKLSLSGMSVCDGPSEPFRVCPYTRLGRVDKPDREPDDLPLARHETLQRHHGNIASTFVGDPMPVGRGRTAKNQKTSFADLRRGEQLNRPPPAENQSLPESLHYARQLGRQKEVQRDKDIQT